MFFDGAPEVIKTLKGRVLQCAVTNGTRTAQRRKLALAGMDRIFDHIFISDDLGAEKPGRAFFDRVFETIGPHSRQETLIVGDSLSSDIRGGVDAGIRTCWYNPWGRVNTFGLPIDYEITHLSQVPEIVLSEQ